MIHASSPTISNAFRTIAPGLVSTSSPSQPALIRFRARTRAPMPLESMNVRSDRSTMTVEPASSTSELARPSADATSNSPCSVLFGIVGAAIAALYLVGARRRLNAQRW